MVVLYVTHDWCIVYKKYDFLKRLNIEFATGKYIIMSAIMLRYIIINLKLLHSYFNVINSETMKFGLLELHLLLMIVIYNIKINVGDLYCMISP